MAPSPITELSNPLTYYMDVSTPADIVRMMRSCDGQIFSGFAAYASVYDKEITDDIDELTDLVAEITAYPKDGAVIIGGAGSSGRIAFMVARACNAVLLSQGKYPCFQYLIAGGDEALLRAQEGAEDDATAGVEDLTKVLAGGVQGKPYSRYVYIGLSCGLTSTYVAAQLRHVLLQKNGGAALIGFNAVDQARSTPAEGSSFSFADVIWEMEKRIKLGEKREEVRRFFIITPVVGPEAVAGSTRLKAGTATKMLLEVVLARALAKVLRVPCIGDLPGTARQFVESASIKAASNGLRSKTGWQNTADAPLVPTATALGAYEAAARATYQAGSGIAELMDIMASSWSKGGSVYYVGKGGLGLVGLLDASEQVPTFGAKPEALQAFVTGSWADVQRPFQRKPKGGGATNEGGEKDGEKSEEERERRKKRKEEEARRKKEEEERRKREEEKRRAEQRRREEEKRRAEQRRKDEEAQRRRRKALWESSDDDDYEDEESEESSDEEEKLIKARRAKALAAAKPAPKPDSDSAEESTPKTTPGQSPKAAKAASGKVEGARENGRQQEGKGKKEEEKQEEDPGMFANVTVDHFVKNVLPKSKPEDTVVLLESRAAGVSQEFPRSLIAAVLERISSTGLNLALVSVEVAPHDRLLFASYAGEDEGEGGGGRGAAGAGSSRDGTVAAQGATSEETPLTAETIFADVADLTVRVRLPAAASAPMLPLAGHDAFGELAVKLILNAASTGAQALVGKVYANRMVDLRITNEKLLKRAQGLVAEVAKVDAAKAQQALKKVAVLGLPKGADKNRLDAVTERISALSTVDKAVPTAILLSSGKYEGLDGARKAALKARSIRVLLKP